MYYHYKLVLFLVMLLIPLMVLVVGNKFESRLKTVVRALTAVGLTWIWVIAIPIVVVKVDIMLANSPETLQEIYDGDGAKNAFAVLFGWVPGLVLVIFYWLIVRFYLLVKSCLKHRRVID